MIYEHYSRFEKGELKIPTTNMAYLHQPSTPTSVLYVTKDDKAFLPEPLDLVENGQANGSSFRLKSPASLWLQKRATLHLDLGFQIHMGSGVMGYVSQADHTTKYMSIWSQILTQYHQGNLLVQLTNASSRPIFIRRGQEVAQIHYGPSFRSMFTSELPKYEEVVALPERPVYPRVYPWVWDEDADNDDTQNQDPWKRALTSPEEREERTDIDRIAWLNLQPIPRTGTPYPKDSETSSSCP